MSKKKIVIIVGAVIVLFGALGGAYWTMQKDIKSDAIAASESPANVNDGLLGFVSDFYAAYEAQQSTDGINTTVRTAALEKYGTANAVANFQKQEGECYQNIPPSVTADDVASLQNPFTVNVTYNFTEDPATAVVTVVSVNGTLKIDGVSC